MRLDALINRADLGLRVFWGQDHLHRQVYRVYTTDLLRSGKYLRGGELVLSSTLWRTSAEDSMTFVRDLASGGAVALAAGTAMLGTMPSDLVRACHREGLVLLHVPDGVSFAAITEAVVEHRQAERNEHFEEIAAVRRSIQQTVSGQGLDATFAFVKRVLNFSCWVVDFAGRPLFGSSPLESTANSEIGAALLSQPEVPAHHRVGATGVSLLPLERGSSWTNARAYLACTGDLRHWSVTTREAVDELVRHSSIELAQEEAREAPRRAFQARIISELHTANPAWSTIETLMAAASLDPSQHHRVLLAAPRAGTDPLTTALATLARAAADLHAPLTAVEHGTSVVAITPAAETTVRQWRTSFNALAKAAVYQNLTVGIGGAYAGANGLSQSLAEARQSLVAARGRHEPISVASLEDVDTLEALLRTVPTSFRDAFCDRVLGRLIAYDRRYGSQLLETLETVLTSDDGTAKVASRLNIHPNTLRYRLKRADELTGHRLGHWHDRTELVTAIRMHRTG